MIACECGGCGSTYKVKDQNAGKKFQCKHCDEMVRVPGGGGASKQSSGRAGSKRRKKAARRKEPEYDEYDDYAEDEYDDGYDDYGDDDDGDDDYDDYEERRPAPRSRSSKGSSKKKKKKKKRRSAGGESLLSRYATNPLLWIGVPLGIGLFVALLSLIAAPAGLIAGFGSFIVCGIISACCGLHSLILAFKEDAACGLMYLFVPFYSLYYLITRWEEQREPFVTQISMTLAMVLAMVGMAVGG